MAWGVAWGATWSGRAVRNGGWNQLRLRPMTRCSEIGYGRDGGVDRLGRAVRYVWDDATRAGRRGLGERRGLPGGRRAAGVTLISSSPNSAGRPM